MGSKDPRDGCNRPGAWSTRVGVNMAKRTCSIDGCDRPHSGRGWCSVHYGKWRKTGDPNFRKPDLLGRFEAKTQRTTDCWLWTGYVDEDGYGKFYNGQQVTFAHRVAHELFVGPIPDGYQVDHVKARGCVHRHCVNPAHLEAVPPAENNARSESTSAKHMRKTHCKRGHEFTPENTYSVPGGGRNCRTCRKRVDDARTARRRATRAAA